MRFQKIAANHSKSIEIWRIQVAFTEPGIITCNHCNTYHSEKIIFRRTFSNDTLEYEKRNTSYFSDETRVFLAMRIRRWSDEEYGGSKCFLPNLEIIAWNRLSIYHSEKIIFRMTFFNDTLEHAKRKTSYYLNETRIFLAMRKNRMKLHWHAQKHSYKTTFISFNQIN